MRNRKRGVFIWGRTTWGGRAWAWILYESRGKFIFSVYGEGKKEYRGGPFGFLFWGGGIFWDGSIRRYTRWEGEGEVQSHSSRGSFRGERVLLFFFFQWRGKSSSKKHLEN